MEPWFAEHELLIRMMVGLTALTLGSYGFTWVCYLLVGARSSPRPGRSVAWVCSRRCSRTRPPR